MLPNSLSSRRFRKAWWTPMLLLAMACGDSTSASDAGVADARVVDAQLSDAQVEPQVPDATIPPDAGSPGDFDHVAVLPENLVPEDGSAPVRLTIEGDLLSIETTGFPNEITSVTPAGSPTLTDADEIAALFRPQIDAASGFVELHATRAFDFETDAPSYAVELNLGDETHTVLVRLFDVQYGTEAEPLTINSIGELASIGAGHFVSENIGDDIIELPNPESTEQNTEGLTIALGQDIDASGFEWTTIGFEGTIDGKHHVIDGLNLPPEGFIQQETRFPVLHLRNLGLTNVRFSQGVIQMGAGDIEGVFIEGVATASSEGQSVNITPFAHASIISYTRVYTNITYDLSPIGPEARRFNIAGLVGSGSSSRIHSGYSNGAIVGEFDRLLYATVGGIYNASPGGRPEGPVYSAIDTQALIFPEREVDPSVNLRIGGFTGRSADLRGELGNDATSTTFPWRFVTDRNGRTPPRAIDFGSRDTNYDGVPEPIEGIPDYTAAGMTEAELRDPPRLTGPWENGSFQLDAGEFPVLRNMPYPHTPGASWMSAPDPGVAYQRATFDDRLSL